MNNIINYNHKLINNIWNDRGIKITIIYNILKYYNKIKNKNIIINNKDYRLFAKIMFPELIFKKFNYEYIDYTNNFYFNIREILINKDIFIDYIHEYIGKKIPTKKLFLIPWFDINDPIISFRYSKSNHLNFNNEYNKIIYFGNFVRNNLWDNNIENDILRKYIFYKYHYFKLVLNINIVYNKFYSLLKNYYKNIDKPNVIIKPVKETVFINNNNKETIIINNPDNELNDKESVKEYIKNMKSKKKSK